MDTQILARIYCLVAQMEAIKARIEGLKRQWPEGGDHFFMEASQELEGIASELQQLGHY